MRPGKLAVRMILTGALSSIFPAAAQDLAVRLVAEGLTAPLHLEEAADGSGRKFIAQLDGVVRVLRADNRLDAEPFLDLRPRMLPLEEKFEERGLLGFALHPNFARNGRVFATKTPVVEYPNMQASHPETRLGIKGVGTAVTGARMYRGRAIPALAGRLVVSD